MSFLVVKSQSAEWVFPSRQIRGAAVVSDSFPDLSGDPCKCDSVRLIPSLNPLIPPFLQKYLLTFSMQKNKYQDIYVFKYRDTIFSTTYIVANDTIDKFIKISKAHLKNGIAFIENTFRNRFEISGCQTEDIGNSYFFRSQFHKSFFLEANDIRGFVNLEDCIFFDSALFYSNNFYDHVYFNGATFKSKVSFGWTRFDTYASFANLKTGDSTQFDFTMSTLPDTIDFSYNQSLKNEIDLTLANYMRYNPETRGYNTGERPPDNRIRYINLYRSDIQKFHLDYSHFRLLLTDPAIGFDLSEDESTSIYEALLKNFKDRGQMESYKLLDIEYQQFRDKTFLKFNSRISKWWWNFGYDKGKIFGHTFLFLILFSLANFFWLNNLNNREGVYHIERIPRVPSINSKVTVKKLFSRLWYSFMYTSCIFFLFSLKTENLNFKKSGIIYIIFLYILGIVCIAYMAGFVLSR